jgi:cytochrome c oxidase cbb3-type subunit III
MPSFEYLGDDLLHALVLHLRSLQGNRAATPLSGNAQRGKELFFGKGECSSCHMVNGQGGFYGSDLTAYARGRSPEAIHDAIVFPNRDLDPRRRTLAVTLPDGKSLEGIAQNEDNFSIQLLTPDGTLHLLSKSSLASLTHRDESPMPADYGKRFSAAEIDDLVSFLSSTANKAPHLEDNRREPDED